MDGIKKLQAFVYATLQAAEVADESFDFIAAEDSLSHLKRVAGVLVKSKKISRRVHGEIVAGIDQAIEACKWRQNVQLNS